jgi:transcriptional repressor NrdR
MKCPHCDHPEDKVVDSRPIESSTLIRRRRECLSCNKRFTTHERLESMPLVVIKSNDRRETFDRNKLKEGIERACEKRPISSDVIEQVVSTIEDNLQEEYLLEVTSKVIGEITLEKLKDIDAVAYIRFASVYKQFADLDAFLIELKELKKAQHKSHGIPDLKQVQISKNVNGDSQRASA